MEMQEVKIIIGRDGVVNVAVNGVPGSRCLDVTQGFETAVGKIKGRDYTASYYEQDRVENALLCKEKIRTDPPS